MNNNLHMQGGMAGAQPPLPGAGISGICCRFWGSCSRFCIGQARRTVACSRTTCSPTASLLFRWEAQRVAVCAIAEMVRTSMQQDAGRGGKCCRVSDHP